MKKLIAAVSLLVGMNLTTMAQTVVPLYTGTIPDAKPTPASYQELADMGADGVLRVSKVSVPTLTVYRPEKGKANGTAVIICPGGGYGILAMNLEGTTIAQEFNKMGVTAFVLKYRLPDDLIMKQKAFGPLQDAQQAMYVVRKRAAEFGIQADKIGIMGFSAGGHLAASLSVHYADTRIKPGDVSLRPDFSILMYPVISLLESPHTGSAKNLAGGDDALQVYFSNEWHVNAQTPPAFLVHAADDAVVPVKNSMMYAQALADHQVKVQLQVYQAGGHGFGLNNKTTDDSWMERLRSWMKLNQLL